MPEAQVPWRLDLSELRELYGEDGLQTLLAVALDELDCQRALFDTAFQQGQLLHAAEALHRLTGTAAFFARDERSLDPLYRAERALRLSDVGLAKRTLASARAALAALSATFLDELARHGGTK